MESQKRESVFEMWFGSFHAHKPLFRREVFILTKHKYVESLHLEVIPQYFEYYKKLNFMIYYLDPFNFLFFIVVLLNLFQLVLLNLFQLAHSR